MYDIKTEDIYKDIRSDKEMLNFSNYSPKSKYYDDSNKLIIGKWMMKLEALLQIIW